VGEQRVINNASGMSSAYDSLRRRTNSDVSWFSDFSFPDDYPEYPRHGEMAQWFAAYAKKFNLLSHIELANPVNRITYDNDQYHVESYRGTETLHSIVVASGKLWCSV
jgi:dimethylaniline monooxygenase (N-oxide forming)